MRKWVQKIVVAGSMLLMVSGCASAETDSSVSPIEVSAWEDEEGIQHVFIPSFCEKRDVSVTSENLSSDVQYHQSANVATLFINTESGSMDAIHVDKEYREEAEAMLYTADGTLNFSTTECSLKGRGNTTWDLFEKKPYQLKLEEKADLLGMGEGKKWILLANAFDETHLRNKMVFDLARENDFCYAPECEYVDLYLNGEYRGLYLLTERVEFGDGRLNISADDKYMCNIEFAGRWATLENAFLTEYGRAVEIREPDEPSENDMQKISEGVQNLENEILNLRGDTSLSNVIDIDSWVYKYLIDEITENGDADIASSYFYYADGKFYAGPLWDYDNTMAISTRNQNPRTFMARSGYTGGEHETPYYDALYEQDEFYDRMVELYRTKMKPAVNEMKDSYLAEEEALIKDAVSTNRIRWGAVLNEQNSLIKDVKDLSDYLEQRMEFLDTVWLDGEEYCTVQFEPYVIDMYATEETYAGSYAVKKGEYFSELEIPLITDLKDVVWVNSATGAVFDPDQIITENITLMLKREEN